MSIASILSVAGRAGAKSVPRFLAVACAAALLFAAVDGRAATLNIGNAYSFSTGSTAGNPAGSWTLGDKMWTYGDSSGFTLTGTGGPEAIQIIDTGVNFHSFQIGQLQSLVGSGTWSLGYNVKVLPPSPYVLNTLELAVISLSNNTNVYKDVFGSLTAFNAGAGGQGTGSPLFSLSSNNGAAGVPSAIPGGVTEIWVRDWIVLDGTGTLSTVNNQLTQQAVPEIDVASMAGAFPLLMAGLALLERRRRRPVGGDCLQAAG